MEEGFKFFFAMTQKSNLSSGIEHCGCIASLLARHGKVQEVLKFMSEMPLDPDAKMLGSPLSAC